MTEDNSTKRKMWPKVRVKIDGMTCHSCVKNIEETIGEKDGIKFIKVNLEKSDGIIEFDENLWTPDAVATAIDDMGYDCKVADEAGKVFRNFS